MDHESVRACGDGRASIRARTPKVTPHCGRCVLSAPSVTLEPVPDVTVSVNEQVYASHIAEHDFVHWTVNTVIVLGMQPRTEY